jgi:dihydroxyacetone kinase DhaKLM complex PTS-EIIA-like component DhaM
LTDEQKSKVIIADAPVLEGAMMAAVEASTGSPKEKVMQVAESAHLLKKLVN